MQARIQVLSHHMLGFDLSFTSSQEKSFPRKSHNLNQTQPTMSLNYTNNNISNNLSYGQTNNNTSNINASHYKNNSIGN
jgi:hypothetical protein